MRNWILVGLGVVGLMGCGDKEDDTGAATTGTATSGVDGEAIYADSCGGCHGADGSGGFGSSLIDTVPGYAEADLVDVVTNGLGSDMPAFGSSLSADEIDAVVAYLLSTWG